ncbi:MAG: amidase [Betaproteobacteria bacterium]|nr:amidase [Betaproteobacteria bacterium]
MYAIDAVKRIASTPLTARVLLREYSQRIEEVEPHVQAWETLDVARALDEARACDLGPTRGILHGIPIGVKDIIDAAGLPTRCGSPIYASQVASADAACVALAKAAGAIVMGKTVTTELAWFHPGKTRNPHNLAHTPGGSSSGSAAAVAAGMVPIAFGTQTAGSVIRPAAYCGVVGFKPSFGLVPRAGVKSQSESLDTIGWMANCVDDIALMAEALTWDTSFRLPDTPVAPRIGVLELPEHDQADAEMLSAIESALRIFASAGANIRSVSPPAAFNALNAAQTTVQLFEAARSYHCEYSQHKHALSARLAGLLEEGRLRTWDQYRAARAVIDTCKAFLPRVFDGVDVLLLPAASGAAPAGLEATGDPVFNRAATALHLPALTLPHFRTGAGMPLGIQFWGWSDVALLQAARWAEQALLRHC